METENSSAAEPFLVCTFWELECTVQELQSVLIEPLAITRWWAPVFLHAECINEGQRNRRGYAMRCFTKGFLPHSFQFIARITDVRDDVLVIETEGDFDGVGTVKISSTGAKTKATVEWSVNVSQPYIRPFLKVLKPIFVWNHRWAMRQGHKGLERMMRSRTQDRMTFSPSPPTFPHNLKRFQTPQKWRV